MAGRKGWWDHIALETAEAAALHGRVADISDTINLSKRVVGNIARNTTIALGLKAIFLVTTIVGVMVHRACRRYRRDRVRDDEYAASGRLEWATDA